MTLVALILSASVLTAMGTDRQHEHMQSAAPQVKKWGGWILVAVGWWFILLTVFSSFFAELFPV